MVELPATDRCRGAAKSTWLSAAAGPVRGLRSRDFSLCHGGLLGMMPAFPGPAAMPSAEAGTGGPILCLRDLGTPKPMPKATLARRPDRRGCHRRPATVWPHRSPLAQETAAPRRPPMTQAAPAAGRSAGRDPRPGRPEPGGGPHQRRRHHPPGGARFRRRPAASRSGARSTWSSRCCSTAMIGLQAAGREGPRRRTWPRTPR